MKNSSAWGYFINPFTRIAGWQAFIIGLIFVAATGVLAVTGGIAFDGVLDVHAVNNIGYGLSLLLLGIDILTLVVVMWLAGLIVSEDFRFIDILGTMTLARAPMIILSVVSAFITLPEIDLTNPQLLFTSGPFVLFTILTVPVMIWYISLMYNGMKVSLNIKGAKMTVTFIVVLLLAEVISKVAIYYLLK